MGRALLVFCVGLAALMSVADAFEIDPVLQGDKASLKQLQIELKDLGYAPGSANGTWGKSLQTALKKFHAQEATDLAEGLSPAIVERVHLAHRSWFAPPVWVKQQIFTKEFSSLTVDISAIMPECEVPECNISMFFLAAEDLTGDKVPELVFSTIQFNKQWRDTGKASPLVILERSGNGFQLMPPERMKVFPRRVHGREANVADFNGDGVSDLFVAAHGLDVQPFPGEPNLLVLSGPNATLTDMSADNLEPLSAMNHGSVAHDVDADGDTDLFVVTNWGSKTIDSYFLMNDGTGKFKRSAEAERLTPSLRQWLKAGKDRSKYLTARFADVNADGHDDLLLAVSGDDGNKATKYPGMRRTRVVLNDGANHWLRENAFELPVRRWDHWTHTTDIDAADVDGDGDVDLLLTQSKGGVWRGEFHQLLLNDGTGKFTDATATHLWQQGYPDQLNITPAWHSFLRDLDNDGDLDIVAQMLDRLFTRDPASERMVVALNDGKGHFAAVDPHSLASNEHRGGQLRPVDYDGDGDLDLIGIHPAAAVQIGGEFYSGGFQLDLFINKTLAPK